VPIGDDIVDDIVVKTFNAPPLRGPSHCDDKLTLIVSDTTKKMDFKNDKLFSIGVFMYRVKV
jgi:hypothetical protein